MWQSCYSIFLKALLKTTFIRKWEFTKYAYKVIEIVFRKSKGIYWRGEMRHTHTHTHTLQNIYIRSGIKVDTSRWSNRAMFRLPLGKQHRPISNALTCTSHISRHHTRAHLHISTCTLSSKLNAASWAACSSKGEFTLSMYSRSCINRMSQKTKKKTLDKFPMEKTREFLSRQLIIIVLNL